MEPIIKIENLSKQYRLGDVGTGTLSHDLNRWWARIRGKEDPFLKIGETNNQNIKGESDYVWALKDINLEVMPGEVLGIIGKNGAGKSTLLKLLSRVTAPTTGSIKARGRIASLLEVGTGFHPELTGRENIFLNGTILGMTNAEIRSKFDEIVDFAGVERYLDTPVKRYSSGMYVRLAFAVAAHLEPEILVVDEVLAVGDAEFQKKAIGKMQDVSQKDGRTVLFVSHNLNSIKRLCTRGIILKQGVLDYFGTIDETVSRYLEVFTNKNCFFWENDNKNLINDYIIPKKLYLLDSDNKILDRNISKDSTIQIVFEFYLAKINPNITLGISILNQDEIHLFRSLHTDSNDNINNMLRKGFNKLTCEMPMNLLNEGNYKLIIDGGIYKNSWDFYPFCEKTPYITFTIEGGFIFSKYWQNKRNGVFAPILIWKLN